MARRWDRRDEKVKRRKEKPRSNRKGVELLLSSIRASARRVLRKGKQKTPPRT